MNLAERLSIAIRAISFAQRNAADAWVRSTGLTRQQAFALGYIEEYQDEGVIARDLADMSGTTPASVTSLLQGLEDRGLVTRMLSPRDSRVKLLRVTPAGSGLIKGFDEAIRKAQLEFFAPLSAAEQNDLLELLERIIPEGADEEMRQFRQGGRRPS